MVLPWEIPHLDREHHALPIGEGWWRAPAARTGICQRALEELDFEVGPERTDGAGCYRFRDGAFAPERPLADGDPDDPVYRAHWIAARLFAAREAWRRPLPEPCFMAVLNLTPDSFSDGGDLQRPGALARAARRRHQEGAAWLDLGAESTRPGSRPVAVRTQLARLLPAVEKLADGPVPVSVDTRSARVAERCLDAGATMINDVSALADPEMAPLAAGRDCPLVLMHSRGSPADMRERCDYRDLLGEVADELMTRAAHALASGIRVERLTLDPGIGFAKTAAQSLQLVAGLGAFRALGFPLLAGPSRKSYLTAVLGERPPKERDGATAGAAALCAAQGAAILRLHGGGPIWDAVRTAWSAAVAARPNHRPREAVSA